MKQIKCIIVSCFAIICVAFLGSVFTSCSNDDDLLLAGDSQTKLVSSICVDSVKTLTRSSSSEATSLGTLYVSGDEGYVDETSFTFTLTSTTSNPINNNRVRVYILFYAPYGGTYANEMVKTTYTNGNIKFSLIKPCLTQYGTYTVRFAYTIDNANPVTNSQQIGSAFYIDIQCRVITITDDYPYYDTSSTSIDPSGFYRRYCTSWVAWKINQMWGTTATTGFYNAMYGNSESQKLGDAEHWLGVLQTAGYSTNSHPKTGDIAYWSFGHVAFVNSVLNENSIIITEYNNPSEGASLNYNWRTINRNSTSWPTYFIHVQTKI